MMLIYNYINYYYSLSHKHTTPLCLAISINEFTRVVQVVYLQEMFIRRGFVVLIVQDHTVPYRTFFITP